MFFGVFFFYFLPNLSRFLCKLSTAVALLVLFDINIMYNFDAEKVEHSPFKHSVFFTARACRCSLAFPCLANPVSHLVWILLCTYCVRCSDCELHFSRPAVCLQVAGGHPLGFLANSMAQQTAGIQCSRPPSYFPQVLNGLLGTAEVIHKKWYMKIKAQNFNAPRRSGSFSWAKMHAQEAALKQTRRVMTLASSMVLCTCGLSLMSLIVGCNLDWTHCITVVYTHH